MRTLQTKYAVPLFSHLSSECLYTQAATSVHAQTGGAWTTVGAGGKTNVVVPVRSAVSTPTSTKPSVQIGSSNSLPAAPSAIRSPAVSSPAKPPVVTAAMKLVPSASKTEETPIPVSHEFLKWMADSLKGLNNSVNRKYSMLWSFVDDA